MAVVSKVLAKIPKILSFGDNSISSKEFAKGLCFLPCLSSGSARLTEDALPLTSFSLECRLCDHGCTSDLRTCDLGNFSEKYEVLLGIAQCRNLYLEALTRFINHIDAVSNLRLKNWWTAEISSCFRSSSRKVRQSAGCVLLHFDNFKSRAVLKSILTHRCFDVLSEESRAIFEDNMETLWLIYENFHKSLDELIPVSDTIISTLGDIGRYHIINLMDSGRLMITFGPLS